MIHNTFVVTNENVLVDVAYENIHDVPLVDKAKKALYKDSKTSLLSALLLLANLNVMNGISYTEMMMLLSYEIFICM